MTSVRLVKSELLKLRTTRAWWIFVVCSVLADGLALGVNLIRTHFLLSNPLGKMVAGATPEQVAKAEAAHAVRTHALRLAADVFNSGELLGGLFSMLLATLLVTNEYHHQTATTTFLTTPRRTPVIVAKLVTAILAAGMFWLLGAVINVIVGSAFFQSEAVPSHLGEWEVVRSMLLNLMVYALWAIFGVGIGALIRNQLAATIGGALGYLVGAQVAQTVFLLVHAFWIKKDWVLTAMVIVPSHAAGVAVSPIKTYPQSAPQWVGVAVMVGYGLLFGAIGTYIIRKRDVA